MADEATARPKHRPARAKGDGGLFQFTKRGRTRWRATAVETVTTTDPVLGEVKVKKTITGTGDTPDEAEARLRANLRAFWQQSADRQAGNRREVVTVEKFYRDRYLSSRRTSTWKPQTRRGIEQRMEQHVLPEIGSKPIAEVTVRDIHQLVATLTAKGLSDAAQVNTWRNLNTMFQFALREGAVRVNPLTLVDERERPQKKLLGDVTLPEGLVTDLQKRVAGTEDECLRMMSMMLGLRQGELLGLTWDCVTISGEGETATGLLKVRQQLQYLHVTHGPGCERKPGGVGWKCGKHLPQQCPHHPTPPETGHVIVPWTKTLDRTVALVQPLIRLLIEQKQRQDYWKRNNVWEPLDRPKMDNLIFTTKTGKPLRQQDVGAAWRQLLADAGHPNLEPHKSRYIAATSLILNNTPLPIVSNILGHVDSRITERVYTQISVENQRRHLEQIGRQVDADALVREARVKAARFTVSRALLASVESTPGGITDEDEARINFATRLEELDDDQAEDLRATAAKFLATEQSGDDEFQALVSVAAQFGHRWVLEDELAAVEAERAQKADEVLRFDLSDAAVLAAAERLEAGLPLFTS